MSACTRIEFINLRLEQGHFALFPFGPPMDRLVKNSGWYLNLVGIALAAPIVRFRGPKKVATFDEDTGAKDDGQKLGEDPLALPLRASEEEALFCGRSRT